MDTGEERPSRRKHKIEVAKLPPSSLLRVTIDPVDNGAFL